MNELKFLTAGMPLSIDGKGYKNAFKKLNEINLNGLEVEFVHGVRINTDSVNHIKQAVSDGFTVTCHGPFYINLNAREPEKVEASVNRILETARTAKQFGGYSITYHAAFYMGNDKKVVFDRVAKQTEIITNILNEEQNDIFVRPETTGKGTQWGDIEEIVQLSTMFDRVLPCVDFAHLHARSGGAYNTYDEFCKVFELIGNKLGNFALENFHAHVAGIEYSAKGEKKHLNLDESDMNYKDLLKAFKTFNVKGVIISESPNIEGDAKLMKEYYLSI